MSITMETTHIRPTEEIMGLIEALRREYLFGSPPLDWIPALEGTPSEMHGNFLGALTSYDPDSPTALEAVLRDCEIDNLQKLRAILRVVTSYGALAALSWALEHPVPTWYSMDDEVLDRKGVLDEICGIFSDDLTRY